jgi:hypothetical protein
MTHRTVPSRSSSPPSAGIAGTVAVLVLVAIVLAVAFGFGLPRTVDAGETCMITSGGAVKREVGPGWRGVEIGEDLKCLTNRPLSVQAVIGDDTSQVRANYKFPPVDASSSDGQYIEGVPYAISFSIPRNLPAYDPETLLPMLQNADTGQPVDAAVPEVDEGTPVPQAQAAVGAGTVPVYVREDNVAWVYTNVGTSETAIVNFMKQRWEAEVKTVVQLFSSEDLFSGDLTIPSDLLYKRLFPVFHGYGLWLESAKIATPDFNDAFVSKRNDLQLAELDVQIAQQKTNASLETANQTANIAAGEQRATEARAMGDKNASVTRAEGEAQAINLVAEARATSNRLWVDSFGGPEAFIAYTQAVSSANWPITTIIGETGILPIFDVGNAAQPVGDPSTTEQPTG